MFQLLKLAEKLVSYVSKVTLSKEPRTSKVFVLNTIERKSGD